MMSVVFQTPEEYWQCVYTLNYTGFENGTTSPAILTHMRNLGVDENSRMKVINVNAKINLRSYWSMPGMDSCSTHNQCFRNYPWL